MEKDHVFLSRDLTEQEMEDYRQWVEESQPSAETVSEEDGFQVPDDLQPLLEGLDAAADTTHQAYISRLLEAYQLYPGPKESQFDVWDFEHWFINHCLPSAAANSLTPEKIEDHQKWLNGTDQTADKKLIFVDSAIASEINNVRGEMIDELEVFKKFRSFGRSNGHLHRSLPAHVQQKKQRFKNRFYGKALPIRQRTES